MREILFRGKRVDNGEWVYWDRFGRLTDINGEPIRVEINTSALRPYAFYINELPVIKAHTVGDYTGLTDKNGKRIFEGDIVKTKEFGKDNGNGVNFNNFDIFEVIYSSSSFKLNNSRRLFNMLKGQGFEVIGNIHDNPELLQEDMKKL